MTEGEKAFDPYNELGVARDATERQIRDAYRDHAKVVHPNAVGGGDLDAFMAKRRALVVLIDSERRAKFDTTGDASEPDATNPRINAVQIIDKYLAEIIQAFVNGGFKPELDPRRMPVMDIIRGNIQKEIATIERRIFLGRELMKFLTDISGRFSGGGPDNLLAVAFSGNMRINRQADAADVAALETTKLALEMAKSYQYRHDR